MALFDIITPRLTEIGKIKIGRKSDKERTTADGVVWYAPEKVDYFILTTLHRDAKGQLIPDAALMNSLTKDPDGKIRRLPIRLLSNDPEDVMKASYCWYGGRSIGARSDGKTVTWFVGRSKENWCKKLKEPVTEPWDDSLLDLVDGKGNKLFKQHAEFNCVIASKEAKFGGVHRFRTTSTISASQLYGGLMHIMSLTGGVLVGLPLQLVVRPLQVNPTTSAGKKTTSTVYVVHVELHGKDLQEIQNQAREQARFMVEHAAQTQSAMAQYRKLLRAPGFERDDDEVVDINEEFHPETADVKEPVKMPRAIGEVEAAPDSDGPEDGEVVDDAVVEKVEEPTVEAAAEPAAEPEKVEPAKPEFVINSALVAEFNDAMGSVSSKADLNKVWDRVKQADKAHGQTVAHYQRACQGMKDQVKAFFDEQEKATKAPPK